jgi:hypothetical protein
MKVGERQRERKNKASNAYRLIAPSYKVGTRFIGDVCMRSNFINGLKSLIY